MVYMPGDNWFCRNTPRIDNSSCPFVLVHWSVMAKFLVAFGVKRRLLKCDIERD